MKAPSLLFLRRLALLPALAALLGVSAPSSAQPDLPPAAPSFLTWSTLGVDCPRALTNTGDRSLRLDSREHEHLVYGWDHLYYAWHDGAS